MGRARRRPGAQLYSAQRGNGKTNKQTNAEPRFPWRAGKGVRRGGGGGGGVGAEGFAALVWRLRSPTPSPAFVRSNSVLCCDGRRSLKSALGLHLLEGAQVPGLKLCRLFEMCTQCLLRARPAGGGFLCVFVGFAPAAVGLCARGRRRIQEPGFAELITLCRYGSRSSVTPGRRLICSPRASMVEPHLQTQPPRSLGHPPNTPG